MNSSDNNARVEQQEIDASARWPVLVFFSQALAWLVIGGALQLIAAIQLHTPDFLGSCAWFTYGRISAAASFILTYGWGFNAGLGVALWLMARLSAAALRHGGWLVVACKAWNITLGLGLLGILLGGTTSFEMLEMPRWVSLMMLVAYAAMGVWAITTFSVRNTENVFASQWYVFAAILFFPWMFAVAQTMLFTTPTRGVVQAIVGAWYVNGIHGLWFTPLALAAAYYFVPKVTGRPIPNYYLASLGFWWLLTTLALAGGARLIGGPVPSWVPTLGVVANYLAVPAVIIILTNFFGALRDGFGPAKGSVTFKFMFLSLVAFFFVSVLNLVLSNRGFAVETQFTFIPELRDWVTSYAFFTTAMFGAAYFIVPRLAGRAWHSSALVSIHFYLTAVGIVLLVVGVGYAGSEQGRLLNSTVPFADITAALKPWLMFRSLALMLLLTGHVAFLINFLWTSWNALSQTGVPAVIANPPAMSAPASEGQHA
ncbi:MAG: cbb3-type cytochrome c oxidase subunit I [Candidatus Didemnitutus sp.]|jgi:cytochrome c oxidase cbb3-type subunit 1|nr:cbb3-type cytochrome c oxidase subunit I [Candidatus Didemnitutus sp.]